MTGEEIVYDIKFSDNCSNEIFSCDLASGSLFPVGETTVTCTSEDVASNTPECSFIVEVERADLLISKAVEKLQSKGSQ